MNMPANIPQMNEASIASEQARIMAEIQARQSATRVESIYVDRQGFRIGELRFLARFDATSELSELPTIYRLPGAPAGVKGLANLHGNVVPVFELAHFFGIAHGTDAKRMLLVLGSGENAAAVVIDGLPERKRFLPTDLVGVDTEHPALSRYSLGSYKDANGIWTEFDAPRFFENFAARSA
jgi:twitching motility protein PilI